MNPRWLRFIRVADGCWPWTGARLRAGYGVFEAAGKQTTAHRVVYEALVGPIPPAYELHHRCRNRWCVNPAHVEPMTRRAHLELEGQRYSDADVQTVRQLRSEGLSFVAIQARSGISKSVAHRIARKGGGAG